MKAFPYPAADYEYKSAALETHWARLHRGDCEPYPALAIVKKLVATYPDLKPKIPLDQAAQALQAAWRAFHYGEFKQAEERGLDIGLLGFNVANKAANIRATYLENGKRKFSIFLQSARRAEELQCYAPGLPNAWYLHAQALGRHAQGLSILNALTQGVAGKVKASLEKTLELEPHHADAHIALGLYHAEVIEKVGVMVGGLTYGVSRDAAVKHFEKALKLNSGSAIARVEYAKALRMMFGGDKTAHITRLLQQAAQATPADAMERLDIELARTKLED